MREEKEGGRPSYRRRHGDLEEKAKNQKKTNCRRTEKMRGRSRSKNNPLTFLVP